MPDEKNNIDSSSDDLTEEEVYGTSKGEDVQVDSVKEDEAKEEVQDDVKSEDVKPEAEAEEEEKEPEAKPEKSEFEKGLENKGFKNPDDLLQSYSESQSTTNKLFQEVEDLKAKQDKLVLENKIYRDYESGKLDIPKDSDIDTYVSAELTKFDTDRNRVTEEKTKDDKIRDQQIELGNIVAKQAIEKNPEIVNIDNSHIFYDLMNDALQKNAKSYEIAANIALEKMKLVALSYKVELGKKKIVEKKAEMIDQIHDVGSKSTAQGFSNENKEVDCLSMSDEEFDKYENKLRNEWAGG